MIKTESSHINYYGHQPSSQVENREQKKQITQRAGAARERYFETKSSVSKIISFSCFLMFSINFATLGVNKVR